MRRLLLLLVAGLAVAPAVPSSAPAAAVRVDGNVVLSGVARAGRGRWKQTVEPAIDFDAAAALAFALLASP